MITANISYVIMMACARFSHFAKVCSGDYTYAAADWSSENQNGDIIIMRQEGLFMVIYSIVGMLWYSILAVFLSFYYCTKSDVSQFNTKKA